MKIIEIPELIELNGKKQFALYDGKLTKEIYDCKDFDKETGVYAILDEQNNVVEYMDILGNFTTQPTLFAREFYYYISSRSSGVILKVEPGYMFFTSLTNFPSRFLANAEIRKIVKDEEMYKYKTACENMLLSGFVNRLRCKRFLLDVFKGKVKRGMKIVEMEGKEHEIENYYNF